MPVLKIKTDNGWENISGSQNVTLDTTLTQSGMAADAKAIGDALDAIDSIVDVDNNDDGKFLRVVNGSPAKALPFIAISTSAYNKGDCCIENDIIYRSLIDNNTWALSAYPQGWEEVQQV